MSRTHVAAARHELTAAPPAAPPPRPERGLYVVCATVTLERFSFFLLSAILVIYLNERLGFSTARAVEVYGYFLCGSYLTPLVGGWLCDGRLGYLRTALLGAGLQSIGYLLFFAERSVILYGALALTAIGSGLFKAGTQALLGSLYTTGDSRREHAFSVFYKAINIGAFWAPVLGGWTQVYAGWAASFALASVSALLSISVLALCHRWVGGTRSTPALTVTWPLVVPRPPARRQLALVLLAGVVFAACFVQSHSSLLLWARDRTDRHVGGFEIPVAWFAAAPAALVLLAAPVVAALFAALRRRQLEPSTPCKIALGIAVSGLAFVPLWITALLTQPGLRVSPLWVLGCMTVLAIGELLVPALAPAEMIRIAPPEHHGRWLSYWFLALAAGNMVGGWVHF